MRPEHPHAICKMRSAQRWLQPLRRRWPLWLLLGGALLLLATRLADVRLVLRTLAEGRWEWVLAALVLQGCYLWVYAALYQSAFATVGVHSRTPALIPVLLASILASTVAPTGGLTSAAILIQDAARRRQPTARAAEGVLLVWVAGLAAAIPMVAVGLGYLRTKGALRALELATSAGFLAYTGLLMALLLMGAGHPARLLATLAWFQRRLNALLARLGRRPPFAEDWAQQASREAAGAARAIVERPGMVARTLGVALLVHVLNIASLQAIFMAFSHGVDVGALAAGYGLAFAFSIVSVLPFDVGVVEGFMALVYASMGVPAAKALVVAVAFRGLNAWLPVILGLLLIRLLWPAPRQEENSSRRRCP